MRNTARHPTTHHTLYVTAALPTTTANDKLWCLMTDVTLACLYSASTGLDALSNESHGSTNDHGSCIRPRWCRGINGDYETIRAEVEWFTR